ncbi:MAG: glycosyl hydrolase family 28-related protein [Myxococcota bacterium]|nr:glycosyl hydrolase family 28-related protein [Myxococcota bacterium]
MAKQDDDRMTTRRNLLSTAVLGAGGLATFAALRGARAHGQLPVEVDFENEEVEVGPTLGHVSVTDYGAVGDYDPGSGTGTDDTAAIQNAINAAIREKVSVYFPVGTYKVTTGLILESQGTGLGGGGLMLFTDGRAREGGAAAILVFVSSAQEPPPLFDVRCDSQVRFSGLILKGPGKPTVNGPPNTTGIRFHKNANADDVDAMVTGCCISGFGTGILLRGRGLRVESNLFSHCVTGLEFGEWPGNSDYDGQGYTANPASGGARGYFISSNRSHTCSDFVKNTGEYPLWGLVLTNNLVDIGDRLFQGACRASLIANNVVCHCGSGTIIHFKELVFETTVTGNVLSGAWSGDKPTYGIGIQGTAVDLTISNNVISHIKKDAIVFYDYNNQSGDWHQDIAITGNAVRNIALDDTSVSARGAVRFGHSADRVAITGNSFRVQTNGVEYAVLCWNNGTLNHSKIVGNVTNADFGVMKGACIGTNTICDDHD